MRELHFPFAARSVVVHLSLSVPVLTGLLESPRRPCTLLQAGGRGAGTQGNSPSHLLPLIVDAREPLEVQVPIIGAPPDPLCEYLAKYDIIGNKLSMVHPHTCMTHKICHVT